MSSSSQPPIPTLPAATHHNIPPAAQQTAQLLGKAGWFSFWGQLTVGAVILALLALAIVSRTLDDGDRTFWVGLAILTAIVSFLGLLLGIWLALRLTRCARRLALPYMQPTPSPARVQQRVLLTTLVSLIALGISILGTAMSALSLLAKTLAHPQGAALYSPQSTLRVLDVLVILINSGLATIHFASLALYAWMQQRVQSINP